ncbi:diacylglycerol kinase [Caminibacter sp.]
MKKKYNLFKNASYAMEGVLTLLKERAFQLELLFIVPLLILLFFLNLSAAQKSIMAGSLIIILIAEALNTAVEYTVDLVTSEWHEFAKKAKDTASAGVFFSLIQAALVWGINLFAS